MSETKVEYEIPPGFYTNPDVKVSQALRRDSPMDAVRLAQEPYHQSFSAYGKKKRPVLRLKKDIVIPAGTVFGTAPSHIDQDPQYFMEHIFGLTKDTFGRVIYEVEREDPQFADWFEEVP